jgi:hypothetical protein
MSDMIFGLNVDYFPTVGCFVTDIYVFSEGELTLYIFDTRYLCFEGLTNIPCSVKM